MSVSSSIQRHFILNNFRIDMDRPSAGLPDSLEAFFLGKSRTRGHAPFCLAQPYLRIERLADFVLHRRDSLAIPAENNAIYGRHRRTLSFVFESAYRSIRQTRKWPIKILAWIRSSVPSASQRKRSRGRAAGFRRGNRAVFIPFLRHIFLLQ